mmetsp:Transcript_65653/g.104342  ORF Transcript_65653/g.104342 Transcript_65653/m.104342 type:complete len:190 (+) Transcript_65653:37-606(+)
MKKPAAAVSSVAMSKNQAGSQDTYYEVKDFLHLGLSLRIGAKYTEKDLLGKCKGDKAKEKSLKAFLSDPSKLRKIPSPEKAERSPRPSAATKATAATAKAKDAKARKNKVKKVAQKTRATSEGPVIVRRYLVTGALGYRAMPIGMTTTEKDLRALCKTQAEQMKMEEHLKDPLKLLPVQILPMTMTESM